MNRVHLSAWQPWVSTVARLVLAGVFFAAGGAKISDPNQSVAAVNAYDLFPSGVAEIIGYGLPFLEIALGLLLLIGLATRLAAAATAVLMVAFIAGVASAWARGLSIDCGCFGGGGAIDPDETQYVSEILRDLGFLALAAWLVVFPTSRFAVDRAPIADASPEAPTVEADKPASEEQAR